MIPFSAFFRPLSLAGLMLTVSACGTLFGSGEPTPGDRMIAQGEAVADLGEMWNEGNQMVERADSLTSEGERLMQRGRETLDEGRTLTEDARTVIERQQREYANFAAGVGPMATFEAASDQRDQLDQVVRQWRRGQKRLEKGQKLIEKGHAQIEEGRAKIAEADAMRLRGNDLMQRAEQTYTAGGTLPASWPE